MQLVAYGAQDIYLTGNPQITFFKVLYRRHTNFSIESIEQTFNGTADFGKKVTCTVSRNGDLIHRTYLRVELPSVTVPPGQAFRWLNWVGQLLISSVEIEIGGQRIDKHYGDWLHIWNELTQTAGHQLGYSNMCGNTPDLTNPLKNPMSGTPQTIAGKILYVPLEFWFNRNPGLALPLIALQYHEVKFNLEFRRATDCYWAAGIDSTGAYTTPSTIPYPSLGTTSLFVDYIYLDTDERRRFAQVTHEYLIEQLQFTGDESANGTTNKIKLSLNHPCKELIWVVQPDANVTDSTTSSYFGKQWFNYTDALDPTYSVTGVPEFNNSGGFQGTITGASGTGAGNFGTDRMSGTMPGVAAGGAANVYLPVSFDSGANPVSTAILQLNGHDRFSQRDGRYFNLVQPYQHHENVPSAGINVYSFSLRPEDYQPTGTCNFSRIDNATLQLNLTPATISSTGCKIRVYATNYNVLRIMSGMGGLAYSN